MRIGSGTSYDAFFAAREAAAHRAESAQAGLSSSSAGLSSTLSRQGVSSGLTSGGSGMETVQAGLPPSPAKGRFVDFTA